MLNEFTEKKLRRLRRKSGERGQQKSNEIVSQNSSKFKQVKLEMGSE
jgi:hypothetical protein